jgi:hypothetical protein
VDAAKPIRYCWSPSSLARERAIPPLKSQGDLAVVATCDYTQPRFCCLQFSRPTGNIAPGNVVNKGTVYIKWVLTCVGRCPS